jgi:uncharacterized protein YjaG (DUF416 family)
MVAHLGDCWTLGPLDITTIGRKGAGCTIRISVIYLRTVNDFSEEAEENRISTDTASYFQLLALDGTRLLCGWSNGVSFVANLLCLSLQPRYATFSRQWDFESWSTFRTH